MFEINVAPQKLYEGCIQAVITHAVAVGKYPEFNYEHSRDGIKYSMNDSQGCIATITFHDAYILGVFQDIHKVDWGKDALDFFEGASEDMIQIAKDEALQYVLEDVEGVAKPVVTAAFWGTWKQLFSTQSLADIVDNGGHIIHTQLLPYNAAVDEWCEYYDLDTKQVNLINRLFDKKIASNGDTVTLLDSDIQLLYGDIEECLVSLGELNIRI